MLVESARASFPSWQTLQVPTRKGLVLPARALWGAGPRSAAPTQIWGIPVATGSPCTGRMVTLHVHNSRYPGICGHLHVQPQVWHLISNIPKLVDKQ